MPIKTDPKGRIIHSLTFPYEEDMNVTGYLCNKCTFINPKSILGIKDPMYCILCKHSLISNVT